MSPGDMTADEGSPTSCVAFTQTKQIKKCQAAELAPRAEAELG